MYISLQYGNVNKQVLVRICHSVVFLPVLGSQLADLSRLQQQLLLQLVGRQRVLQQLDLYTRRLVQHLVEDKTLNLGNLLSSEEMMKLAARYLCFHHVEFASLLRRVRQEVCSDLQHGGSLVVDDVRRYVSDVRLHFLLNDVLQLWIKNDKHNREY